MKRLAEKLEKTITNLLYFTHRFVRKNWPTTTSRLRSSQAKKMKVYRLYLFWRFLLKVFSKASTWVSTSSMILEVLSLARYFINPESNHMRLRGKILSTLWARKATCRAKRRVMWLLYWILVKWMPSSKTRRDAIKVASSDRSHYLCRWGHYLFFHLLQYFSLFQRGQSFIFRWGQYFIFQLIKYIFSSEVIIYFSCEVNIPKHLSDTLP